MGVSSKSLVARSGGSSRALGQTSDDSHSALLRATSLALEESGVKLLRKLGLLGVILTNVFQGNYEEAKSNLSNYKEIHYVVKGQEVSFDKVLIGFKCYVLYQHRDRQLCLKLIWA